jgi:hypothetical protein
LPQAPEEIGSRLKVSEHLSGLIRQLEDRLGAEVDEACFKSRRALSEELNQMMRRLRQCHSTEAIASWLVESAASFGGPAALFEVMDAQVRGVLSRGFAGAGPGSFEGLEAPLAEAPAFRHLMEERETVVATGTAAELSTQIVNALAQPPGEKVYLYPMVIEEKVVAILYVTPGGRQTVENAALELLTGAAAGLARILASEESSVVRKAAPELIGIEGVDLRASVRSAAPDLRRQALEARARWFARTEVARMRLYQRKALELGRVERDIYSALRPQIEAARRAYAQDFLAVSPVIADHLHRELVRLAHDDANLLGPGYPGSLV